MDGSMVAGWLAGCVVAWLRFGLACDLRLASVATAFGKTRSRVLRILLSSCLNV
jgi:hypothetical protein